MFSSWPQGFCWCVSPWLLLLLLNFTLLYMIVYDLWDDSIGYKYLPQDNLSVYLDMSEQPSMSSVV